MKRTFAVFLTVLLLTGCTAAPEPSAEIPGAFCLTAAYHFEKVEGTLFYEQDGAGACELVFLSPESLNAMTLSLRDGIVTTTFLGITTESALADLSPYHPLRLLFESAMMLYRDMPEAKSEEDGTVYTLENGARFHFREEVPVKIEYPSAQLELTILEYKTIT